MTDGMMETLSAGLPALGLALPEETLQKLCAFARAMVKQNEVMNLTGITEETAVAKLHLLDSLTVAACVELQGKTLIDVGCGAGFPGVPLAIACPDTKVTLLDSLQKRLNFLEAVSSAAGCETKRIHARAEDAGREPALRESYDIACARAVAAMPNLCEYCLPFVKKGGVFIAMKGPGLEEELAAAERALRILGGKLESVHSFTLADGSERNIAVIRKTKPTPPNYPRPAAKMKKQPW